MQITLKRANHTSFKSTRQTSPETGLVAFFHQVQHGKMFIGAAITIAKHVRFIFQGQRFPQQVAR